MKCPACNRELTEIKLESMTVNACVGGCAGLWLDHFGLKKVEYSSAKEGETLLNIQKDSSVQVNLERKRTCPKCNVIMMQHFFSIKRKVTVDECPKCSGFWLDAGELAAIRSEFSSEAESNTATEKYFNESFGSQLEAERQKDKVALERAQKIRNAFGIISPSNYTRKF
jgi:Zn-finger nucleic acid-binding protein